MKINPKFSKELQKYGAVDFSACFNCGNCTATCDLATNDISFPRELIRYCTLGLEDEIKGSLKPWLCYSCGSCATECPRQAEPAELMMSLRRWLTAKYDWTGLSGLLYKSLPLSIIAFILAAIGVYSFAFKQDFDLDNILHFGHLFESAAIISVFAIILLPNIIRMWWFTTFSKSKKIDIWLYLKSLGELFVHMFTQKRALGCDDNYIRWRQHLILVFGYLSLLFTTVFFDWFSTTNLAIIILGYVESFAVFYITIIFMAGRVQKKDEVSKHSQPSDLFFVVWLFLMGFTAFLVRGFIDLNILDANKWLYLVHLTILVQWALIIVPFGKWTHFLYRSFAMGFEKINEAN
jgi:ferredoxin